MMQEWIVAVAVACSAWVVLKRLAPPALRRAVRGWTVAALKKAGWSGFAASVEAKRQSDSVGACGSCGNCGPSGSAPHAKQHTITPEALKRTASRR